MEPTKVSWKVLLKKAIFEGLVFDLQGNPLEVTYVGQEATYVIDDDGFLRHVPAEEIDKQVWEFFSDQIKGHEDILSEQAAKMMGVEDIFSKAVIRQQFENQEKQFEDLSKAGIPDNTRNYMGMMGFRVIVDYRGTVLEINQPGITTEEE